MFELLAFLHFLILIISEPIGTPAQKFKPTWVIFSTGFTWKHLPKDMEAERAQNVKSHHQIEKVSMTCFQKLLCKEVWPEQIPGLLKTQQAVTLAPLLLFQRPFLSSNHLTEVLVDDHITNVLCCPAKAIRVFSDFYNAFPIFYTCHRLRVPSKDWE